MLNKGVFCLSIDTELLWGRHDKNYLPFIEAASQERQVINQLLKLLAKYQIPATWAVVGHLFLNSCSKERNGLHPNIVRPKYSWIKGDWLKNDPLTSQAKSPEWYGPDIVQSIKKYPSQEIASHSFSHLIFGDPGCSQPAAESELKYCIELAKKQNIKLTSFVFPRNSIGHLNSLKKYGFTSYRGKDDYGFSTDGMLGKLLMLIDLILLVPHASLPKKSSGLINIPGNMYFISCRGWRKFLPTNLRVWKAKVGIKKAIRQNKVFHLWFHPADLVDNHQQMFKELEAILAFVRDQQKNGKIEALTMNQISNLMTRSV